MKHLSSVTLRSPGTMSLIDCLSLTDSLVLETSAVCRDPINRLYCWNWSLNNSFSERQLSSTAASFLLLLRDHSFDDNWLFPVAADSNNFRHSFRSLVDNIDRMGNATAPGVVADAVSSWMSHASAIAVSSNCFSCFEKTSVRR